MHLPHSREIRQKPAARRSKTWLYLNIALAVTLMLAGAATLFWAGRQSSPQNASPRPEARQQGQTAPNFSLTALNGQTVSLADYRGQVVLLNFWASWCPPCVAELPGISAFYRTHRADGFVVLAVNAEEDEAVVSAFAQANGFDFPVLLDTRAEIMNRYGVRALPVSLIIDRNGLIRYVHRGEITPRQLEEVIGPLL